MSVKRFTLAYIAGATEPGFHDYVLASDYDAKEAELAACRAELAQKWREDSAALAAFRADAEKWRKAQDMALLIYDERLRVFTKTFLEAANEYVDGVLDAARAAGEGVKSIEEMMAVYAMCPKCLTVHHRAGQCADST